MIRLYLADIYIFVVCTHCYSHVHTNGRRVEFKLFCEKKPDQPVMKTRHNSLIDNTIASNNSYLGKPSKKVWNFPYFSGVDGFEKVIFHKNAHGLKMLKIA